MNINFELYRIFYTVAKHKNITKAAEELYISQPAVSKAIKNLERSLGGKLFNRTKKGVILTEEGAEFYNYIATAIDYINNAEHKFNDLMNLEVGTIKIGASSTLTRYFLAPYLDEFHKKHPKIKVEIYTDMTFKLLDKLKNGLVDLVILNLPYESSSNINIVKLKKVQDGFYVNDNYKDLFDKELSLKDLENYQLLLQSKNSNTGMFLSKVCEKYDVELKPDMLLAGYSLVYEFTKIGFGIGYLTDRFILKEDKDKLHKLNIKEKIPFRHIGLAYSKVNLPTFATKELINIITKSAQ